MRKSFIIALLSLFTAVSAFAYNINNINRVNVGSLTQKQLKEIKVAYANTGMDMDDFVAFAKSKGMNQSDAELLKEKLENIEANDSKNSAAISNAQKQVGEKIADDLKNSQDNGTESSCTSNIFGFDMFSNSKMSFAPSQNMPTPRNYIIGPGDMLVVDVYGYSENTMQLTVSSEGTVRIPNIGPVQVNGISIEAAEKKIKKSLSQIYSSINTGHTQVSVTIGNIKSINVFITGNVKNPGTYTLSSLSNVYNALYACAGPSESGSLRNIKVVRGGKDLATIDLYSFLSSGNLSNNISLKDQDVIYVPNYGIRVSIEGATKHSGIFEMKEGETLKDLLTYAGGFTENAYQNRITVQRTTDKERSVADVSKELFSMFKLQTGDQFIVSEVLNKFTNRVQIKGSVFRPGPYALEEGMTLYDLIRKADGLKEDAYMERATVTRLRDDLTPELINFNVKDLIDGKFNMLLKREDEVTIGSNKDLEEQKTVRIYGQVLVPGQYTYYENMTVKDLIFLARGFKEFAETDKIELTRKIKDDAKLKENTDKVEVKILSIDRELVAGDDADIKLEPNDMISVRLKEGVESTKSMSILGEVRSPGDYVIVSKRERISDILARTGGLTSYAYAKGAFLIRSGERTAAEQMRDKKILENLAENKDDKEELMKELKNRVDLVGIRLDYIIKHPGSEDDIFVENGDMIFVPKELQTFTVSGHIQIPGMQVFRSKSLRRAVKHAGGWDSNAHKRGTYVAYANGDVKGTGKFLWIKNYPAVEPGSHIYVPDNVVDREKVRTNMTFFTTILSSLISAGSVAVSSLVVVTNMKK